jgi:hypothetical protein
MGLDINKLIKEAHETAVEKGWWDTPNDFETQIANIHAELSEAWEDYRNNRELNEIYFECQAVDGYDWCLNPKCEEKHCQYAKPCGIPVELADTIIRIGDTLGNMNVNPDESTITYIESVPDSLSKFICLSHRYLVKVENEGENFGFYWLIGLIYDIETFCKKNQIDLEKAIKLKMAYNKTRPYRHGNKKA